MQLRDVHFAFGMLYLLVAVVGLYLARAYRRGRARHARTDADGGSVFLAKPAMEMGYWMLEPLIAGLASLRITPNAVTVFSLVPALLAGVAAAFGWFGLACVLGTGAALCDLVDGVLARRLGVASDAGEVFDAAVDRYGELFLLVGLGIYFRAHWVMLLLVFASLGGSFMISYTTAKAEAMGVPPPRGSMRRAERAVYLLTASGLTSLSRFFLERVPSDVLRELPIIVALALVAVVSNVSAVQRFAAIARDLRARHPAPPVTPDADVILPRQPETPGPL